MRATRVSFRSHFALDASLACTPCEAITLSTALDCMCADGRSDGGMRNRWELAVLQGVLLLCIVSDVVLWGVGWLPFDSLVNSDIVCSVVHARNVGDLWFNPVGWILGIFGGAD